MFVGLGVVSLAIMVPTYARINAQRDKQMAMLKEEGAVYDPARSRELGDRAPDFRYTL